MAGYRPVDVVRTGLGALLGILMSGAPALVIPVIDDDRRVIGVLSITDLFNRDVVELGKVETIMKSDVVTLPETADVAEPIPLMTDTGYQHVPIVDADDRLVGMVTRGELIAVLNRALLDESP